MMCKCGYENKEDALFCSGCGLKIIEREKTDLKFPQVVTVKEAYSVIFNKSLSITKIYDLVKTKTIPHVKAGSKILLDVEKTLEWWNKELDESMKFHGLRRII